MPRSNTSLPGPLPLHSAVVADFSANQSQAPSDSNEGDLTSDGKGSTGDSAGGSKVLLSSSKPNARRVIVDPVRRVFTSWFSSSPLFKGVSSMTARADGEDTEEELRRGGGQQNVARTPRVDLEAVNGTA